MIEGGWEDILQHAAELQGRRLRVIVLPEPNAPTASNLRQLLGEYVGCIQGRPEPSAEKAEQTVEELIAEAHRAQGIDV
ncbi:MAG: hypothetical protein NZ874_10485 [Fimbriimonadales bacterium]|nr:hypothetical protein [Fimbriimonadales bacterium]